MDIQRIISLVKETKDIITNREMAARVKEKSVADYRWHHQSYTLGFRNL